MSSLPTIVLVHGAWHGSWCWADVSESLRERGFDVIAVDLPGHDAPGSSKRIWNRMGSYVRHVTDVVDGVAGPVVVVGHSMGGLVVQRVVESRAVDGIVLVASVPTTGAIGAALRTARRDPIRFVRMNLSLSLWQLVEDDDVVRQQFFCDSTPQDVVSTAGAKMQNESFVAYLSMIVRPPRPRAAMTENVLVISAEHDHIFTMAEQERLATAYGVRPVVIDAAHDLMLEPEWPELVDHIADFGLDAAAEDISA